jgi:hypothetical protein
MGDWVRIVGWIVVSALKSQRDLTLEDMALRHQLMVIQRQPGRVRLKDRDRLLWIWLRRVWPGWHRALVLVQPSTVVKWHRNGFRAHWRWKSRSMGGRPRIDPETRMLILDMWSSNPTWGKPRIQAELHKIGDDISDSTVWRYRPHEGAQAIQLFRKDKLFGFEVPTTCPKVPSEILGPVNTWGNKNEYWQRYDGLAARFIENFKLFSDGCPEGVEKAGPKRLKKK